jgi:hypothetical protein
MGEYVPVPRGKKQGPVPTSWGVPFKEIVKSIAARDATFSGCSVHVEAEYLRGSWRVIDEMGVRLAELPDGTWSTSVCIRMGEWWDVLVDLYDVEQGRIDLVLPARVRKAKVGIVISLDMIHVP